MKKQIPCRFKTYQESLESTFKELQNYDDSEEFNIGTDTGDIHNEYNQKDIDELNKLIASEQSALSEYLEAAKETNVDILSRLYSDIGDEERFHTEQLMFAKASLTGEKYEPHDPDVKKEYEELLSMGMDEETAMVTAIDKMNIIDKDNKDDSDVDEIKDDLTMLKESYEYVYKTMDLADIVMETSINHYNEDIAKQFDIFVESYLYTEAMDNISQVTPIRNPISLLISGIIAICKFINSTTIKFKNYISRLRIKQKRIQEWIKVNGIQGIFQKGVSLYFYSPNNGSITDCFFAGIKSLMNYTSLLFNITRTIGLKTKCFDLQPPKNVFKINNNIPFASVEDGLNKIRNVVMSKTKIVVTGVNEDEIRSLFFGYTDEKINGNSKNIYNILDETLIEAKAIGECISKAVEEIRKCENNQNSIFYKNKELYDWGVRSLTSVTNGLNKYIKCLVHDMNTVMSLNNGILEQTRQADQTGQKTNQPIKKI